MSDERSELMVLVPVAVLAAMLALVSSVAVAPLRAIEALDASFAPHAQAFLADAAAVGTPLRVDETRRTFARQAYLYLKYLLGGPKAAPPGESMHERGLAFDAWPIGVPYSDDATAIAKLDALAPIAARHGIKTGASYGDHDHFERAA